jgi:hypothetical protein
MSTPRAVQDQRNDQFAFGLAVTCDVTWVRLDIRNKIGGFPDECVSADTAWFGGRNIDELTGGLAAEWA